MTRTEARDDLPGKLLRGVFLLRFEHRVQRCQNVLTDPQFEHDRLLLTRRNVVVVGHCDTYLRGPAVGQGHVLLDRGAAQGH